MSKSLQQGKGNISCLLCGSTDLVLLTDQLRHGPGRVWQCDSCRIARLETDTADLAGYYDTDYRERHGPRIGVSSNYEEIFEAYVGFQGPRIELLAPWLRQDARLLEVGCSTGHFLYNVKDRVGEVVGVDYDRDAAAYASRMCGCATYGGDLASSGLKKNSFDIVCALQVMEHVEDPVEFAQLLKSYVGPNGIVYVQVPNLDNPLLTAWGKEEYRPFYFHDAHLFYLSAKALSEIMRRAGFKGDVHFLQEYNLLNHLSWYIAGAPQQSNRPGMGPIEFDLTGERAGEVREEIEALMSRADAEYRRVLAERCMTDQLVYIGHPSEEGAA